MRIGRAKLKDVDWSWFVNWSVCVPPLYEKNILAIESEHMPQVLKGPFCDPIMLFLWLSSVDMHKTSLFLNFLTILMLCLWIKHDLLYHTVCHYLWCDLRKPITIAKLIFWVIDIIMWKFKLFSFHTCLIGSPLILVSKVTDFQRP